MRTQIGYKVTDNKVAITKEQEFEEKFNSNQASADDLIMMRGYEKAAELLQQYLDRHAYPFLRGEQRDEFFMDKFKKTRERFFEPI